MVGSDAGRQPLPSRFRRLRRRSSTAIVARAHAAGIGRMVSISTRVKRRAGLLAIAERFPEVYCSVGTHPHHAHEELDVGIADLVELSRHPKDGGDRRSRARLSLRFQPARGAGARLPQSYRGRARDRAAARHSFARSGCRHGARSWRRKPGRGPSRPCCIASPAAAIWRERAVALGLYVSFTGILTFKKSDELRAIAAELPADRILVETDAPYLAPGRHRGKRNEPAFVVETAKVLAETRRRHVRGDRARRPPRISFACSARCRAKPRQPHDARVRRMSLTFTILGCGSSGGVPRPALGWGACDPANPKNRRRRCSLLVERHAARRAHPRSDRHLARFARAAAGGRGGLARRRPVHPRARRPHPRDRRSARAVPSPPTPHRRLSRRADLSRLSTIASATASSRRRAATIRQSSTSIGSTPAIR